MAISDDESSLCDGCSEYDGPTQYDGSPQYDGLSKYDGYRGSTMYVLWNVEPLSGDLYEEGLQKAQGVKSLVKQRCFLAPPIWFNHEHGNPQSKGNKTNIQ